MFDRHLAAIKAAADNGIRLQLAHPCALRVGFDHVVATRIKPQNGHLAIVRQQLIEVLRDQFEILLCRQGPGVVPAPAAVIPVLELGIIDTELEPLLGTFLGEFLDDIALKRG